MCDCNELLNIFGISPFATVREPPMAERCIDAVTNAVLSSELCLKTLQKLNTIVADRVWKRETEMYAEVVSGAYAYAVDSATHVNPIL